MKRYDVDGGGTIDIDEFRHMVLENLQRPCAAVCPQCAVLTPNNQAINTSLSLPLLMVPTSCTARCDDCTLKVCIALSQPATLYRKRWNADQDGWSLAARRLQVKLSEVCACVRAIMFMCIRVRV